MRKSTPERLSENPNPTSKDVVDWIAEDLHVLCEDAPVHGVAHLGRITVSLAVALFGQGTRIVVVEERTVGDEIHANVISTNPDIPSTLQMLLEAARQLTDEMTGDAEDEEDDSPLLEDADVGTLH